MPRKRKFEKSKDFKGSMKRLLKSLSKWNKLLIFAFVLAMASAIISLITPNKLSDVTDIIMDGIKPNVENIKEVAKNIYGSFNQENLNKKIPILMNDSSIDAKDKQKFMDDMKVLGTTKDKKETISIISNIPDGILVKILDSKKILGQKITSEDQAKFIKIVGEIDPSHIDSKTLEKLDVMPKSIYKLIEPQMNTKKLKSLMIFLGVLIVISAIFSYVQQFAMTNVTNGFAKKIRSDISIKINKLPLKYFDTHETGDLLSRVTNDVDSIAQNMNQGLAYLVASITLFLGSIVMMFYTNYIMAISAILSSLIGFYLMGGVLKKSQKYFIKRQEELGNLNGYIEEIYSGHNVVSSYNGIDETNEEFDKLNGNLYTCSRKSQFLYGIMQPFMVFIGNFGYVVVCVVGALLTMHNVISFGVIVAFMIYVRMFTNQLSEIAQTMTSLQSTAAASERVFEFLDEDEMELEDNLRKSLSKSKVNGKIEFKNVKFGYDKSRLIIKDFSANAKPGEKIAIVGPTGAGKTTLVNLLMKFYNINNGDILIDNVSTKDITRENVHDLFVMVLQDTWLFNGTIRDNIKFNKENVSDEEIWSVCRTVEIDHFISSLPNGLDTIVSDNDMISQGQKQLLTIARGMIKDAPFLILDEATSNVDTRTEELVQKAMDKLTEGRTSFIIAHRLSTIKNADLILVMNEGNIIEQGTHDDLMKQNGFYAKLYNSQCEKTC